VSEQANTPLTIVHETSHWLVICKPQGCSMHTEDGVPGLVVTLSEQLGYPVLPVHRLDKVTSGLLLLAKDSQTAARLSDLFARHRIRKYYLAQSQHKPKKKQGWIKGDMVKGRNGSWLLKRSTHNPAITRFVSVYDDNAKRRLFLLMPHTGKTHQLRVALKSLGSPIDGDQRYGGAAADRTYLHAWALQWKDDDGEHSFTAPPPDGNWSSLPAEWENPAPDQLSP
tara:strand:- start:90807 stop:91481 length:675 start_codon:yes stop_codon:yes gene_type:complete